MKSRILLFLLAIGMSTNLFGQNDFNQKELIGSWLGILKVQGIELRLVFHLSENETGILSSTMDSPDQGAKGIQMGSVSFETGLLKINAPAINGYYSGQMIRVDSIKGNWHQSGQTFEVDLKKQKEELKINRSQEPKPPFPYDVEEVKFMNEKAGHKLAGTLTIPKGEGKFPAVILISGSGAQNRDEELFGHKPFWVIADYLTRKGIVVLRYDDQGVGKSGGSQLNTTSLDYSFDAEAAFNFLRSDHRINKKEIGFAGHSEGGLIAPIVISRNKEVGFFISLAGPSMRGKELLVLQSKALQLASGKNENEIKEDQKWTSEMFRIIMTENDNEKAQKLITENYRIFLKSEDKSDEEIEKEVKTLHQGFPVIAYNWMRYFLMTNPADFLLKLNCPVLVLNGDKDLQVLSKDNLKTYKEIFTKSRLDDYQLTELKNHNHLFQHCTTGLPTEYGQIEESFSPEVLEMIANWINKKFISSR